MTDVPNPFPAITARPGRRAFLKTSLGSGFALAVGPVAAQTIATPATGLVAGEVKVPVADGTIPAYRAMPATGGPFPTMLVIHEIFGVHEWITDVCRRFARLGYYAIAPDLYARQGDATKADIKTIITDIVPKVPDAEVLSDLDATVAFAKASGAADTGRLGATGFCWGGRQIWLYAAHNKDMKAAVAFYGLLGGEHAPTSPNKPKNPVDIGTTITTPVLGLYGGKDENIPEPLIAQMRAELAEGHSPARIELYPDAPHGFFADYRPSYRKPAAEDAWAKAQAWFKQYGVS
ncbi:dienelactone hydrolase family protein [Lichenihabitans sp. Uapishka_5]|uniref:dienelactone hydrolase family protein n=1 Tax=Lichenihabitans sp. Uapishka_5 TaxID=3037302 RepID=UPI0029E827E6|nr:dienelactone hydrolase family protein [Lichenihabitans sp. Uapishka_5]MDX7953853.1 dienelactone hydrolase family protein [Lichenihabitans sp. Uapishka_5]